MTDLKKAGRKAAVVAPSSIGACMAQVCHLPPFDRQAHFPVPAVCLCEHEHEHEHDQLSPPPDAVR